MHCDGRRDQRVPRRANACCPFLEAFFPVGGLDKSHRRVPSFTPGCYNNTLRAVHETEAWSLCEFFKRILLALLTASILRSQKPKNSFLALNSLIRLHILIVTRNPISNSISNPM